MSTFLFVIFIVSAAAQDRCPAAGVVCICAAAALSYMSKKKEPAATGSVQNK